MCFFQVIPRYLFLYWLVTRTKLSTQDRMLHWVYTGDLKMCTLQEKLGMHTCTLEFF